MENKFGQSKANQTSEWQNNKEMNPAQNSSVTDDALEDADFQGDSSWRPTDSALESPTDLEIEETEEENRKKTIKTESPGMTPEIAK